MAVLQRHLDADAEWIAVLRTVAIRGKPLRCALVERSLEFSRVRAIDEALRLIVHLAARQALRIERAVDRGEAERVCVRFVTARGKLLAIVAHARIVAHLARWAERHRTGQG